MLGLVEKLDVPVEETQTTVGRVKWYDSAKGFGFVLAEGFEGEFLLHSNVLNQVGVDAVPDGSSVIFRYMDSDRGLKVIEVFAVERPIAPQDPTNLHQRMHLTEDYVPARVKWFDGSKGYGFVNCFGSSEDVFVGASVLRSAGYSELVAGQALSILIEHTESGQRVHHINDWPKD